MRGERVTIHHPTARTIPRWNIEIEPTSNGPILLEVIDPTMEGAMQQARDWLAKTSYTDPRFTSVVLAGEVVATT